jgi:3-oxoacyl-[acyl-carrier-protein] synthase III
MKTEQRADARYCRIAGVGSALPTRRVTNDELAETVDTSHEWIVSRSGIEARYIVDEQTNTSDLAIQAANNAFRAAGLSADDIDLIIVATTTPDMQFPSTACIVQDKLGNKTAAAFDIQAVCSGFVYALHVANSLIVGGAHRRALVIGAEIYSRILDWSDRSTCVLFGDGAGAVVLEASDKPGILATDARADGAQRGALSVPGQLRNGAIFGSPYVQMHGQTVFKFAVEKMTETATACLEKASAVTGKTNVDWLIPHQANIRIMESTAKRMGVPREKLVATVSQHGNTSAASIPLALDVAIKDGRIQRGDRVLLVGVGGGFTWGSVYLEY